MAIQSWATDNMCIWPEAEAQGYDGMQVMCKCLDYTCYMHRSTANGSIAISPALFKTDVAVGFYPLYPTEVRGSLIFSLMTFSRGALIGPPLYPV